MLTNGERDVLLESKKMRAIEYLKESQEQLMEQLQQRMVQMTGFMLSFGGSSMKSSRSIYSSREKGTWRVPADGSSGLLMASSSS